MKADFAAHTTRRKRPERESLKPSHDFRRRTDNESACEYLDLPLAHLNERGLATIRKHSKSTDG